MKSRVSTWATKAHMTTGAFYVAVGLALLCSFLAGFNIILWNQHHEQTQRIELLRARADAEQEAKRVEIRAAYGRCVANIASTRRVNTILLGLKEFLLDTATDTEMLIRATPGDPANATRRAIVRKRRQTASEIQTFTITPETQCRKTRDVDLSKVS